MSSRPALIAAVSSDTLYLLLPHVTVPEGRERGTDAARPAATEARRTIARMKTMVLN